MSKPNRGNTDNTPPPLPTIVVVSPTRSAASPADGGGAGSADEPPSVPAPDGSSSGSRGGDGFDPKAVRSRGQSLAPVVPSSNTTTGPSFAGAAAAAVTRSHSVPAASSLAPPLTNVASSGGGGVGGSVRLAATTSSAMLAPHGISPTSPAMSPMFGPQRRSVTASSPCSPAANFPTAGTAHTSSAVAALHLHSNSSSLMLGGSSGGGVPFPLPPHSSTAAGLGDALASTSILIRASQTHPAHSPLLHTPVGLTGGGGVAGLGVGAGGAGGGAGMPLGVSGASFASTAQQHLHAGATTATTGAGGAASGTGADLSQSLHYQRRSVVGVAAAASGGGLSVAPFPPPTQLAQSPGATPAVTSPTTTGAGTGALGSGFAVSSLAAAGSSPLFRHHPTGAATAVAPQASSSTHAAHPTPPTPAPFPPTASTTAAPPAPLDPHSGSAAVAGASAFPPGTAGESTGGCGAEVSMLLPPEVVGVPAVVCAIRTSEQTMLEVCDVVALLLQTARPLPRPRQPAEAAALERTRTALKARVAAAARKWRAAPGASTAAGGGGPPAADHCQPAMFAEGSVNYAGGTFGTEPSMLALQSTVYGGGMGAPSSTGGPPPDDAAPIPATAAAAPSRPAPSSTVPLGMRTPLQWALFDAAQVFGIPCVLTLLGAAVHIAAPSSPSSGTLTTSALLFVALGVSMAVTAGLYAAWSYARAVEQRDRSLAIIAAFERGVRRDTQARRCAASGLEEPPVPPHLPGSAVFAMSRAAISTRAFRCMHVLRDGALRIMPKALVLNGEVRFDPASLTFHTYRDASRGSKLIDAVRHILQRGPIRLRPVPLPPPKRHPNMHLSAFVEEVEDSSDDDDRETEPRSLNSGTIPTVPQRMEFFIFRALGLLWAVTAAVLVAVGALRFSIVADGLRRLEVGQLAAFTLLNTSGGSVTATTTAGAVFGANASIVSSNNATFSASTTTTSFPAPTGMAAPGATSVQRDEVATAMHELLVLPLMAVLGLLPITGAVLRRVLALAANAVVHLWFEALRSEVVPLGPEDIYLEVPPAMDVWRRCLRMVRGTVLRSGDGLMADVGKPLGFTKNVVEVLGTTTVVGCLDSKGLLTDIRPVPYRLLLFRRVRHTKRRTDTRPPAMTRRRSSGGSGPSDDDRSSRDQEYSRREGSGDSSGDRSFSDTGRSGDDDSGASDRSESAGSDSRGSRTSYSDGSDNDSYSTPRSDSAGSDHDLRRGRAKGRGKNAQQRQNPTRHTRGGERGTGGEKRRRGKGRATRLVTTYLDQQATVILRPSDVPSQVVEFDPPDVEAHRGVLNPLGVCCLLHALHGGMRHRGGGLSSYRFATSLRHVDRSVAWAQALLWIPRALGLSSSHAAPFRLIRRIHVAETCERGSGHYPPQLCGLVMLDESKGAESPVLHLYIVGSARLVLRSSATYWSGTGVEALGLRLRESVIESVERQWVQGAAFEAVACAHRTISDHLRPHLLAGLLHDAEDTDTTPDSSVAGRPTTTTTSSQRRRRQRRLHIPSNFVPFEHFILNGREIRETNDVVNEKDSTRGSGGGSGGGASGSGGHRSGRASAAAGSRASRGSRHRAASPAVANRPRASSQPPSVRFPHFEQLPEPRVRSFSVGGKTASSVVEQMMAGEFTLLSVVGLRDTVRPHVARSIEVLTDAGIRFMQYSSGNEGAAKAIGQRIGLETDWNSCISLKAESVALDPQSIRAQMPFGIFNIRQHIVHVDPVPLQVSLFSHCRGYNTRALLSVLQDNHEVCAVVGSSFSHSNVLSFIQADLAMAVAPSANGETHSKTMQLAVELQRQLAEENATLAKLIQRERAFTTQSPRRRAHNHSSGKRQQQQQQGSSHHQRDGDYERKLRAKRLSLEKRVGLITSLLALLEGHTAGAGLDAFPAAGDAAIFEPQSFMDGVVGAVSGLADTGAAPLKSAVEAAAATVLTAGTSSSGAPDTATIRLLRGMSQLLGAPCAFHGHGTTNALPILTVLIREARAMVRGIAGMQDYITAAGATVALVQVLTLVSGVPILLSPGTTVFLLYVIAPLLAASSSPPLATVLASDAMQHVIARHSFSLRAKMLGHRALVFACTCGPCAIALWLTGFLTVVVGLGHRPWSAEALLLSGSALAPIRALMGILTTVALSAVALVHVSRHRYVSLLRWHPPASDRDAKAVVPIGACGRWLALAAVANALMVAFQQLDLLVSGGPAVGGSMMTFLPVAVAKGAMAPYVACPIVAAVFLLVLAADVPVKQWRRRRYTDTQKYRRLDFGTRLGMHSPQGDYEPDEALDDPSLTGATHVHDAGAHGGSSGLGGGRGGGGGVGLRSMLRWVREAVRAAAFRYASIEGGRLDNMCVCCTHDDGGPTALYELTKLM